MGTTTPDRPEAEDRPTMERVLAALLHRLASPLGAIVNYAHLLPPGDGRQGIQDAVENITTTLRAAQRLLDALSTAGDPVPPAGIDLGLTVAAALDRRQGDVRIDIPPLPRAAVPAAAAARLFDLLLAHAAGAAPEDGSARLTVTLGPESGVHLIVTQAGRTWSESTAARAFDLFPAADSGSNDERIRLALAGSLARRLGGRAWGSVGARGEATVHLVLPATAADGIPAQEDRQA